MAEDFAPRRAEPDQEFGYTGSVTTTLDPDDEIPPGATLVEIRDDKRLVRIDGVQKTLRAGKDGVVQPKDAEDAALLDAFDLPVARKTSEAPKGEKE
jgi:hypothetical protein